MSKVLILPENIEGEDFVVGDLHGCYNRLMEMLKHHDFDFTKDRLFCVGDLVDRGENSMKCVELLDKPWFYSVMGNHEALAIAGIKDDYSARVHISNGGEWFYMLNEITQKCIASRFEDLPILIETTVKGKKIGIAHATIGNDWEECKTLLMEAEDGKSLRRIEDFIIWDREKAKSGEGNFKPTKNIDMVFLGHTIMPFPKQKHNLCFMDTGCFHTNKLAVLHIQSYVETER